MPEAHVEASASGSVQLAAFAMKYSIFAFGTIAATSILALASTTGHVVVAELFVCLGIGCGTIALGFSSDVKRIAANMSIVHMVLTLQLLITFTCQDHEAVGIS